MIPDAQMRKVCVDRFWDALSGGEMDVDRANFCVMWWSTRGGRELVLFGEEPGTERRGQSGEEPTAEVQAGPYMSGALVEESEPSSKL